MHKIIGLVFALFLIGCGGSTTGTVSDSDTEIKGDETSGTDQEETSTYATDENGKVATIALSGSSEDIAVSKDALFVAKGEDGVDIVKIGYNDQITSELITAIDGINAKSVSLSDDGNKIHVINEEGYVNIIDITNLSNPVKERVTTQQEIQKEIITEDGEYKFAPRGRDGLEIYSLSESADPTLETIFNKANAYDVVLASRDTQALIASGATGIYLLNIATPTSPSMDARFVIDGGTKGLSLNKKQGLLFVANGDKGVLVYNLNSVLDKLSQ